MIRKTRCITMVTVTAIGLITTTSRQPSAKEVLPYSERNRGIDLQTRNENEKEYPNLNSKPKIDKFLFDTYSSVVAYHWSPHPVCVYLMSLCIFHPHEELYKTNTKQIESLKYLLAVKYFILTYIMDNPILQVTL